MATTPPQDAPIVTGPPVRAPQVMKRYWYVLMLADLSWLWASMSLREESIGALAYPTIAPVMHLAMRNDRGALGSLAVRLGALGVAYLSYRVMNDDSEVDRIILVDGVFLGAVAVFDWFYFGRKRVPAPGPVEDGQATTSTWTWTWTPGVLASDHGLQLGVSGAF